MANDHQRADGATRPAVARTFMKSGPFTLDLQRRRLARDGAEIKTSGLPLQILELLLAAPGKVVTRVELKSALWPNSGRIDTERRLNTAMRALREALGDAADAPHYIETLRGCGYRWIGEENAAAPVRAPRFWRRAAAIAACLLLAVVGSVPVALRDGAFTQDQRERFLHVTSIATANPAEAASELDALILERPDHRAARALRAELSMRAWRAAPDQQHLEDAKQTLAEMRTSIGGDPDIDVLAAELALHGDWDWKKAQRLYRRALSKKPDHLGARRGLAWLYLSAGMKDKAWAALESMLQSTTLTDAARADLGWWLIRMERSDLAVEMCRDGQNNHINLLSCRHTALARMGAVEDARDVGVFILENLNAEPQLIAAIRSDDPQAGYQQFLEWRVDHFLPQAAIMQSRWFQLAQLQAEAGSLGAAMASLEQAYATRDPSMIKLASTFEFTDLAASRRYQIMLSEIYATRDG